MRDHSNSSVHHQHPDGLGGVPIIQESIDLSRLSKFRLKEYTRQAIETHKKFFPEGLEPEEHERLLLQALPQTDDLRSSMILLAKNVTYEVFKNGFEPLYDNLRNTSDPLEM